MLEQGNENTTYDNKKGIAVFYSPMYEEVLCVSATSWFWNHISNIPSDGVFFCNFSLTNSERRQYIIDHYDGLFINGTHAINSEDMINLHLIYAKNLQNIIRNCYLVNLNVFNYDKKNHNTNIKIDFTSGQRIFSVEYLKSV